MYFRFGAHQIPKPITFCVIFSHLRALLKIMFLSMHPSYDHSYKLYLYIYMHTHFHLCNHLLFPFTTIHPLKIHHFDTKVGLVIGLGALSLALLSVFGGDLHTKVSQLGEKNLMTCWCFFRVTMENLRVFSCEEAFSFSEIIKTTSIG